MKPDPLWLSKCRKQMKEFCSLEGITLSNKSIGDNHCNTNIGYDNDDDDAATTFLSTAMLPTSKIDLICLGPLTNLAHWLEHIPDFASDRLNSVWILGGNIPIIRTKTTMIGKTEGTSSSSSGTSTTSNNDKEGNDVEAEFNFARDPEAVRKVLNHPGLFGKTIHIVPQEVCNRDAFERSFYGSTAADISAVTTTATADADATSTTITASEIIDDWLTIDKNTPVLSLLPSWMVRLIRTRSFSLYGDPVCIYVRYLLNNNTATKFNHDVTDSDGDNDDESKIRWKNYYSGSNGNKVDDMLEVDSHGRLLAIQSASNTIASTARSFPVKNDDRCTDDENVINNHKVDDFKCCGIDNDSPNDRSGIITIRIVHEVDLGPAYLDWLKDSLTTTLR